MSYETPLSLPIVKFSKENIIPGTASWVSVRNQTRKALEDYGCFEAVCDGVLLELRKAMLGALDELFDLPTETKMKNISDIYHGYTGAAPNMSIPESFGIDYAPVLERIQDFTKLMWPKGNDSFCNTVHSFSNQVLHLTKTVMRLLFESYGAEKYYDSQIGSTYSFLRIIKYRGPKVNESKIGINPHTDKSFITIIHQNQVKGLEVKTKNGDWISFNPSESSFVVMAGDSFSAWSKGRIHSAHHRVIMDGDATRYSMALFTFGTDITKFPEELVNEEHP